MTSAEELLTGDVPYPQTSPVDQAMRATLLLQDAFATMFKNGKKETGKDVGLNALSKQRIDGLFEELRTILSGQEDLMGLQEEVIGIPRREYQELLDGERKTPYSDPWKRAVFR
jgi:hypothetical protein